MRPFTRHRLVSYSLAAPVVSALILAAGPPIVLAGTESESKPSQASAASADESAANVVLSLFGLGSHAGQAPSETNSTHGFEKAVTIKSSDGSFGVQTFCMDGQGRIVALVGAGRYQVDAAKSSAEVHVLTGDGQPVTQWKLDFSGQSINTAPDGSVYVAGDGTIAQYSPKGTLLRKLALPHIAEMLKDEKAIRKQAEEQARLQGRSFDQFAAQYKKRIEKLKSKPADKLTPSEKRQLEQYTAVLESLEKDNAGQNRVSVDSMVASITHGLRTINSVAVSERDVFIVCGEGTGYGYSLWRMDHDFKNAKQVMSGLRGCCGQMDVQVQGNDLLVAANCEHSFARFNREGKKLGQWGQCSQAEDLKCFGGCCNPMNVRSGPNGDVFTAESEGLIKRFSTKGEFVAPSESDPSPAAARMWRSLRQATASTSTSAISRARKLSFWPRNPKRFQRPNDRTNDGTGITAASRCVDGFEATHRSEIEELSMRILAKALLVSFVPALALAVVRPLGAAEIVAPGGHELTVIVMDPLALPLSCPCVKGYAQRDYEQLTQFLGKRLNCPVRLAFSETLHGALATKTEGKADLIIGKDSVIRKQAKHAGLGLFHLAALSGLDGATTQCGLFIVPAKDPALSVSDLKGYHIILGAEDCDEKNLAAQNMIVQNGLPKLHKPETCSACSDGALKILELSKQGTKAATIISSYAKPLLEGCGTVKRGDLRVIGQTESVPFVAAFATSRLPAATREALCEALLDVGRDKHLCKALETKFGFVAVSTSPADVAAKKN